MWQGWARRGSARHGRRGLAKQARAKSFLDKELGWARLGKARQARLVNSFDMRTAFGVQKQKDTMSKCTRCHRALLNPTIVDGKEYGPVCVKKLFPQLDTPRIRAIQKLHGLIVENDEQLNIFPEEPNGSRSADQ